MPSIRIRPDSAGLNPLRALRSVDLSAPLGPRIPMNWPGSATKDNFLRIGPEVARFSKSNATRRPSEIRYKPQMAAVEQKVKGSNLDLVADDQIMHEGTPP